MKVEDFGKLTKAETGLIAHLRAGKPGSYKVSCGLPASNAPRDVHVRANLIRALALNKVQDCPLPERGLSIYGAYIYGDGKPGGETPGLDLSGASLPSDLALMKCHFPDLILLQSASIANLFLDGSELVAGLSACQLKAKHSVSLRNTVAKSTIHLTNADIGGNLVCSDSKLQSTEYSLLAEAMNVRGGIVLDGVVTTGEIRLLASTLGVDLSCKGAKLNASGNALNADRLEVRGSIFLQSVETMGEIRLLYAKLGSDLSCTNARLNSKGHALIADGLEAHGCVIMQNAKIAGEVRLLGAKLGGDLNCIGTHLNTAGDALSADGASIAGTWFWRENSHCSGTISLTDTEIGAINDDPACWPSEIRLNHCRYGAFVRKGISGSERIDWLSRMKPRKYGDDFWPHPYEECARALREAGHSADAREVLIEKERLQRQARHDAIRREIATATTAYHRLGLWLRCWLLRFSDVLLGNLVAYGRRPLQAAIPLVALIFIGAMVFSIAAGFGEIKPNLPQIQRAPEWIACSAEQGTTVANTTPAIAGKARPEETQLDCFLRQPEAAAYPRFDPLIYSADTLLPIVSLEMQSYWIPDDRKPIGKTARLYLWLHIFAGWGLTLLAVAGFSGLIKTDNTK